MIARLTFDTSCVVSLLGRDATTASEMNALVLMKQWHDEGKIIVWISEKSRIEAQRDLDRANSSEKKDEEKIKKWIDTLDLLHIFEVTQGRAIYDISKYDVDAGYTSENESNLYEEINSLTIPNAEAGERKLGDIFDTAILLEHIVTNNHLFVTRDKIFLKPTINKILLDKYHVAVCNPVDALMILKREFELG